MRKDIFPYRDAAGKERWGDPWQIDHRLRAYLAGEDPAAALEAFLAPDTGVALAAADRLSYAAREAFGLGPAFDPDTGEGCTLAVWRDALTAFLEWMEKNAGPASSSPTCSEPTACPSPTPAPSSESSGVTVGP